MRNVVTSFLMLIVLSLPGCGYTTGSLISNRFQTIYIEQFENKIEYVNPDVRELYIPQLENKVRDAVIDRYLFDGNLKIAEQDNTDLILKGKVLSFERGDLRLTSSSDVKEYRLTVTVALTLWDPVNEKVVWEEKSFAGDTTYYTSGPLAKSESTAIQDALNDLARRVVARTVEDW